MFDNIGRKIQTLAQVVCLLGIIASVIVAITMFVAANESYLMEETYNILGFAFLIGGPLISWISSLMCYGFGELIENSSIIARNTSPSSHNKNNDSTETISSFVGQRVHEWRCSKCGAIINKTPCPWCGDQPKINRDTELDELLKSGLITQAEYDAKNNGGVK